MAPSSASAASLDEVADRARALAQDSFQDPRGSLPGWLGEITYDQWRKIRFRQERALWRDGKSPFHVQFFHPGLYYDRAVRIHAVEADGVHEVPFSPSDYDYGDNDFASRVPQDLGHAGLRLHHPIKTPDYHDEVVVFLGASYFRAVGRDQGFGASARGLAIDTAEASGEEFPWFREFWLLAPAPGDREMVVLALLDSRSLTGAYRFVVQPGEETVVDVEARLFLRREVGKLGVAPLTSMFFHGENTVRRFEDFRPEVHDSDGLLVHFAHGEWLWRPLENPESLAVRSFRAPGLKGFGLLQRDREFDHYQDIETRADQRPSVWVTPRDDWGAGRVELVEIPTDSDANDNVVAYWVPDARPAIGEPFTFAYRMHWYGADATRPPDGRVVATRRDRGTFEDAHRFVVDFAGERLAAIPADRVLRGVVSVRASGDTPAELVEQHVVKNPATGGWRLTFQVRPGSDDPVELRAYLDLGGDTLTETWSFVLVP